MVDYALWIDLETTGLESTSPILEVGVLLAENRPPFKVVDAYTSAVLPDNPSWREEMNAYVTSMHTKTGLLAEIEENEQDILSLREVEEIILLMLDRVGVTPSNPAYLAGSGVSHFDQRVIEAQMTAVAKRLRYATLDVGILRRCFESAGRTDITEANYGATFVSEAPEAQQHRAFADILDHHSEFCSYAALLGAIVVPEPDLTD